MCDLFLSFLNGEEKRKCQTETSLASKYEYEIELMCADTDVCFDIDGKIYEPVRH